MSRERSRYRPTTSIMKPSVTAGTEARPAAARPGKNLPPGRNSFIDPPPRATIREALSRQGPLNPNPNQTARARRRNRGEERREKDFVKTSGRSVPHILRSPDWNEYYF